jgi:hypothetical protein
MCQEIAMLVTELKRLVSWIAHRHHVTESRVAAVTERASSSLEFDPAWHGDHWQNLLASPMDARHYVMEDWATTVTPVLEASRAALPGARRVNRRGRHQ